MEEAIKRYFWVVGAATVVVCAVLAARIVGHVVESKVLGDAPSAPKLARVAPPSVTPSLRSKDGKPLVDRSMFCAECVPAVVVADVSDPSRIALTSLPLALIATNVASRAADSFATVLNTATEQQGSFREGDVLPGAGPVQRITYRNVDFYTDASKARVERMSLFTDMPPPAPTVADSPPPTTSGDEMTDMVARSVRKVDDNTFEIDRSLIDQVLANPMAFYKGARVVASMDKATNKPNGFKVYAIRPNSALAKIGLMNGDAMTAVNGMDLTSADKALEVYTKVRESNSLQIEITRRGKPVTLNYTIK